MKTHHIVIEGDPDGIAHFIQVTCVDTGARFWLFEASEATPSKWDSTNLDDQARYFMNGEDDNKRCPSSTRHILLGAVR